MRHLMMVGVLTTAGVLGAAAPSQAQYTTSTYYNPYTGGYQYSAGSYNPYLGGTMGYSTGYNPYTGGTSYRSGYSTPFASGYQRSHVNPYLGATGYSTGYSSPFGGYRYGYRRW